MQKTKLLMTSLTLTGLFAIAGCSYPGVYKIDIQQGNVVTQDMIDQLRPGMTRKQVRFIMGNPLITDTFHANRWDYLYSMQPGGRQRTQERVSITFNESDQLVGLSGDFMPGMSREQEIMGNTPATTTTEVAPTTEPVETTPVAPIPVEPVEEEPAEPGSLLDTIQQEIDDAETAPVPTPAPLETAP
ncbi:MULTISPECIES: outer membrane protein assembly factor BamE [Pseudomonas]|uniref:outer membrane protein assembly factor BamE n=1 Tax=Pseudomonas TaxID=286 RepID=UPI003001371E